MSGPVRIALSRRRGFRLQETSRALNGLPAVKVDRTTMWGNHVAAAFGATGNDEAVSLFKTWLEFTASWAWKGRAQIDLRGRNLACWCKADDACHADTLIDFANREPEEKRNSSS